MHCFSSIMFDAEAMLVASLAASFVPGGAEAVICSPGTTVEVSVTTLADVQDLADALNCTGPGVFDITWSTSLQIEERIDVSDLKNVTVNGSGYPTIGSALESDDIVGNGNDARSVTGIFSVSNGATLSLNHIVFEGVNSTEGGVINVHSSSSLFVRGCTFLNNIGVNGGESGAIILGNSNFSFLVYVVLCFSRGLLLRLVVFRDNFTQCRVALVHTTNTRFVDKGSGVVQAA